MQYITQKELKEMMLLSFERIDQRKEEINKINVFPVPDQDTGGNLAATILGIKKAIENKEFQDLDAISKNILDGVLSAAQGNAGVIYTGFLAGFLSVFQNKKTIGAKEFTKAMIEGAKKARVSIQDPVEGTILDVIDAAAAAFEKEVGEEKDIIMLFKEAVRKASIALSETTEKMDVLKRSNVVDAGGLGYFVILESYLAALEGGAEKYDKGSRESQEKIEHFVHILSNRFEVVALIENLKFNEKKLRKKLKNLGDCLDIVEIKGKIKIHIHTDAPNEVTEIIREAGKVLSLRTEDISKEIAGDDSVQKVSIGLIVENVTSLLPKILDKYSIETAFCIVDWKEGEKLPGENIYQKMREADKRGIQILPKTSQAPPKSYLNAFEKQLARFDKVLCITLSSRISGCWNSAKQAEAIVKEAHRIFVLDSLNAVAGQDLLVLRAIDFIQEKRDVIEIIKKLKGLIPKIHLYGIFEDPKWMEAGGRITKAQANWVRRMRRIKLFPMIELKQGVIAKGGVVFARSMAGALLKKIVKDSKKERKKGRKIRIIINHADNMQEAKKLKKMLKEKMKVEIPFINLASPIVCVHTGPGTLIAAWMAI